MVRAGVLVHVYHLEAAGWESLVWGDSTKALMGTLPKLIQLLLVQDPKEPIEAIIMYTGPSRKDGMDEGGYAKQFLLNHFEQLSEFPQLQPLLTKLTTVQRHALREKIEDIVSGPELVNSAEEIVHAAAFFKRQGITKVYQVAIASHAPRCIQLQATARYQHKIPPEQFWYMVVADTVYQGTIPSDVVVAEPPHRGDDPAFGVHPGIADVIKQYYKLPYGHRQSFIKGVASVLDSLPLQS
jgi:hypothetical protein